MKENRLKSWKAKNMKLRKGKDIDAIEREGKKTNK